MKFDGNRVSFGRHETFALRYSWLTKGFKALEQDPFIFDNDDSIVKLGVGKNMVASIRYWLRASQLITPVKPDEPQEIGSLLFGSSKGLDTYLEDEATIWLVHWLIATNPFLATSWYWFFNKFHKPEFTSQELQTALTDFVYDNVEKNKRPAIGTLKKDALLIPRMYTQSTGNTRTPTEESLDSPLSLLGLITQSPGGRAYQSKPEPRPSLPIGIFSFSVAQTMQYRGSTTIPIEELMYSRDNIATPGSVFRLTEADLITKVELMLDFLQGRFELRDTAGIHQLYKLTETDPLDYIKKHYAETQAEIAA